MIVYQVLNESIIDISITWPHCIETFGDSYYMGLIYVYITSMQYEFQTFLRDESKTVLSASLSSRI